MIVPMKYFLALSVIFMLSSSGSANENFVPPLGFEFEVSHKAAKEQIESSGKRILRDEVDTKEIRLVVFDGALSDLTLPDSANKFTEMEFYEGKLMSIALVINSREADFSALNDMFLDMIVSKYGDPDNHQRMFVFDLWTWEKPDTKVLLSSTDSNNRIKLSYTYKPLEDKKIAKEIDRKRRGEVRSPVDQMFKDGNYSRDRFRY